MADKVKIQPLGMRLVVEPKKQQDVTAGGLIVPPTAQEDSGAELGTVVRLGTGKAGKEFTVKVGQTVFFKKYSPDKVDVDGIEYYVLDLKDILAILD